MEHYRLGYKDPTDHSTIYTLGQFIYEHDIPRHIVADIHSLLGAGNLWKQVPGWTLTPLFLSEPDNHNQNLVDIGIQGIKFGINNTRNVYHAVV